MSCSNFWVRLSRSHSGESEQGRVFPLNPQESQRIPIQVAKDARAQNLKASEQLRQLLWLLQTRSLQSLSEEGKREVKVGGHCVGLGELLGFLTQSVGLPSLLCVRHAVTSAELWVRLNSGSSAGVAPWEGLGLCGCCSAGPGLVPADERRLGKASV